MVVLFSVTFFCQNVFAQDTRTLDSLKKEFNKTEKNDAKIFLLDIMSRTAMSINLKQADELGQQMISIAEASRERKLMVQAYISNGRRCGYLAAQKEFLNRSMEYYTKGLEIARHEKMENEIGEIELLMAVAYLVVPDKDKALQITNEAFSLISTLTEDSLLAEAHNTYGQVYLARNEKTLSLRHYLNALRIAENTENHMLIRACYQHLGEFYAAIEDYDESIDYYTKAYKELDFIKEKNVPFQKVVDINTIGTLFSKKKNHKLAIEYFERSIRMADSVQFPRLKIPAYVSLLNQYLRLDQPEKAIEFMNSNDGQGLKNFLNSFGLSSQLYQAYGVIYMDLGKYDSARYYLEKSKPLIENTLNENNTMYHYRHLGGLYKLMGDDNTAIAYYEKVKALGEKNGDLESVQAAAKNLDTLYDNKGDFKTASRYNSIYYLYKDSIEKLNKANELAQIAAQDEELREAKRLQEKEEAKEKRNRLQYMGITIAIAILFILLVMMGWFKVSTGMIRAIGFVAFLIFFEFLFLVFKKNIYGLTHGEPLYDLLFMIGLAAMLVPLHHWLEHKVIHFLTSHHMLRLRSIFRTKSEEHS